MDSASRTLAWGLLVGACLTLASGLDALAVTAAVATAGAGGWLWLGRARRRGLHVLLLAAATAAGALRAQAALPRSPVAVAPRAVAAVLARVAGPVRLFEGRHGARRGRRDPAAARAELAFPAVTAAGPRVLVRVRAVDPARRPRLLPGDTVRVVGRVAAPRRPTNPGQRDRRERLALAGIVAEVDAPAPAAVTVVTEGGLGPRRVGELLREVAARRIRSACGGAAPGARTPAALLSCLLLGARRALSADTLDDFRRSGAAHLLAVSGLHVVLLFSVLTRCAASLVPAAWRRRAGLPALLVLLALYCAVCRFAVPVMRASVFLAVAHTARAAGRRSSTLDHLAVAAAIVLAVEPAQALDAGFQLSFSAVAGLALLTRRFREALFSHVDLLARFPEALPRWRLRAWQWLARGASASLAAHAATAPVIAAVYGEVHFVGPVTNVVAVPLVGLLLPLAAAAAALGPAGAAAVAPLADAGTTTLLAAIHLLAAVPGATVSREPPPTSALLVALALLAVAARCRPWRPRHLLLPAASILVLVLAPGSRPAPGAEVVVLDVGHGLAVLVRPEGSGAVLFDAGARSPTAGRRVIVPALRRSGVRRLAALFVSHEDSDHCDAVPDVLDAFPVGEVIVPAGFGGAPAARVVLRECRARHVPVRAVGRGDVWESRDLRVEVLHPRPDARGPAGNLDSIVAHVTLTGVRGRRLTALLPGDLEEQPLDALAHDPTLPPADVLVLPHHGRGDPAPHEALARRTGARVLVASTSATAGTDVRRALVTGRDGAVRLRPGEPPQTFPW